MADEGNSGSARTTTGALSRPHVRLAVEMFLLLLGAELTRTLPMPWRVAGVVFSVLAVVQGVRALRAVKAYRRAEPTGVGTGQASGALLMVGIVLAVVWTVVQVAMLAAYPLVAEQESCRDRALTRTAMDSCQDDLVERLEDLGGISVPGA